MKKSFILFLLTFLFLSCNYIENIKKQRIKNDSIEKARMKFVKDSTFSADSIRHINDSINKVNAHIKRINSIKSSINISSCYLSEPNSVGGCDANFYYVNKSNKIIKYLVFEAAFKNNVEDIVACDVSGDFLFRGRDTGPINPGRSSGGVWDCVVYNWSATKLAITSIDIDYTDGTSFTIKGNDLKLIGLKDKQIAIVK